MLWVPSRLGAETAGGASLASPPGLLQGRSGIRTLSKEQMLFAVTSHPWAFTCQYQLAACAQQDTSASHRVLYLFCLRICKNFCQFHSQVSLVLCGVTGTARGAKAVKAEHRQNSGAHWTLSSQILPGTSTPQLPDLKGGHVKFTTGWRGMRQTGRSGASGISGFQVHRHLQIVSDCKGM